MLSTKFNFKILVRVDSQISPDEQEAMIADYSSKLIEVCLETYLSFQNNMVLNCYTVNTSFVTNLVDAKGLIFDTYNRIYIESLGKTQPTTHHMVLLTSGGTYIGVDVAAKQYRQDGVIAEITLAKSQEQLFKILKHRYQTDAECELKSVYIDSSAHRHGLFARSKRKDPNRLRKVTTINVRPKSPPQENLFGIMVREPSEPPITSCKPACTIL